jgi:hypothetical protein
MKVLKLLLMNTESSGYSDACTCKLDNRISFS